MFIRALAILIVVAGLSIALTILFGENVLVALGLILVQLKIVAAKLKTIDWSAIKLWAREQAGLFARFELVKKWIYGTLVPLLMGSALRNRISLLLERAKTAIRARYDAMWAWFQGLDWYEKVVATLIVVFATLALTVSSLGLWLVLFSIKLPLWVIAAVAALGRMVWTSLTKWLFKTLAFLQLTWIWRLIRGRLPQSYLDRKRRWDYRVARAVVRRRRMTVQQLAQGKDSLGMRLALVREYFRQPRPEGPTAEELADTTDARHAPQTGGPDAV